MDGAESRTKGEMLLSRPALDTKVPASFANMRIQKNVKNLLKVKSLIEKSKKYIRRKFDKPF